MRRSVAVSLVIVASCTVPHSDDMASGAAPPPSSASTLVPSSAHPRVLVSVPTPPSTSPNPPTSSAAPALETMPDPARMTGELMVRLTGFPMALTVHDVSLPLPTKDPFIAGKILWAKQFDVPPRVEIFHVYVCEGRCEIPVLDRMLASPVMAPLVQSKTTSLSDARPLTTHLFGMGLGGAIVSSKASSPHGDFDVLVLVTPPPHDVTAPQSVTTFFERHESMDLAIELGRGVDQVFFPH